MERVNYNKLAKARFTKEMNEGVYLEKNSELDSLIDSTSMFVYSNRRRLLFDKGELVPFVRVKINRGYIECSVHLCSNGIRPQVNLGRHLLRLTDKNIFVDHRNRNPLDNRRCNLRECSYSMNLANRPKTSLTNLYKGYTLKNGAARVECQLNKDRYVVKVPNATEILAAEVYDCLALCLFGDFASLNFPKNEYFALDTLNQYPSYVRVSLS